MRTYPGDTTADDWNDRLWWFWRTWGHDGPTGIARTAKTRYISGRARPMDRERFTFCEEHCDWERSRTRISGAAALRLVSPLTSSAEPT